MGILDNIRFLKKEPDKSHPQPDFWIETWDSIAREYRFDADGRLCMKEVDDSRPIVRRVLESFLNKFFPSGYPYSVNEGYLTYTKFRALQHFSSAALSVLSTQSLLFAAGLRPTPAEATAVSWILKDGMQHLGKLICSNMGARMDSEPKRWRILADVLYDLGTGLEVLSPLCPHLFLEVAGLGNFAKGMAVVAARATRLPIYSSFAKEGNLSDLFAKGEAISTLFNVVGLGAGIQLASTICSSMQGKASYDVRKCVCVEPLSVQIEAPFLWGLLYPSGSEPATMYTKGEELDGVRTTLKRATRFTPQPKFLVPAYQLCLVVGPLLSALHIYSVVEEMRAAPINTLNPQRTAMIVVDFIKNGKISSPADLRYRENLLFPDRVIEGAGSVKVGRPLSKVVKKPSRLHELQQIFPNEKFLLVCGNNGTDMVLEYNATGEDALRGWLIAAFAADMERTGCGPSTQTLHEAYAKMGTLFPSFLSKLKEKGWHTDRFLDGTGNRFAQ